MRNEIRMAEKVNEDKLLPQMREAMERYTGKHVPAIASNWDIILNELYPIVQYELPSIYFRNPRAFLKPRNKNYIVKRRDPLTGNMVPVVMDSNKSAKTQEAILNYTVSQIRYKEEVRRCLLDALIFKHGILWHGYKGEFGMTEEQSIYIQDEKVFVRRLSPRQFLFDPSVTIANLDEARWIARVFEVPLQDLKEDDTLDVDPKLKGQPGYNVTLDMDKPSPMGNGGFDTKVLSSRSKTLLDYTDEEYKKGLGGRFARVYEILRRPSKKEKRSGSKGNIILYTPEQEKPLRQNAWPYKAEGWPGKVLMFNEVPDQIFGMADTEVFGEIVDHKNLIVNMQLRNAQCNSKVVILFDKTNMDEQTVARIESGEQQIIGVEGAATGKIAIATPGGQASGELYMLDGRIQQNLDEKSGVNEIRKGVLRSGEESAYSVKQRVAGSSARPAFRQDLMSDFLKDSLLYINQLLKQFLPYEEAVRITGSLDTQWSEKPSKEEVQADVDVEIDVISMLPENPEKEIQELQAVLNLMFEAINNPGIFQKLQQEGKTFNISPIIENLLLRLKIRDPEVFRSIRPEESEGFASVAELRAAQANTEAALMGAPPPSPPAEGQDHGARLSVYMAVKKIFELEGRVSDMLNELIMVQSQLAEMEAEKNAPREGQPVRLKAPGVESVGTL